MSRIEANEEEISLSLDRARVYRALAQLFREPEVGSIDEARDRNLPELCQALKRLGGGSEMIDEASALLDLLEGNEWEQLRNGHHDAFDESSSNRTAPTEMDQLDGVPQLELTRTFEMADVAGFYKAFGVEVSQADQRVDHIATELEFMNLLAVKESVALQEEGAGENARVCHDASRSFLRDHLGRWAPHFGECLVKADAHPVYTSVGRLLEGFIQFDAERIDADGAPVHQIAIKEHDRPNPQPEMAEADNRN